MLFFEDTNGYLSFSSKLEKNKPSNSFFNTQSAMSAKNLIFSFEVTTILQYMSSETLFSKQNFFICFMPDISSFAFNEPGCFLIKIKI